MNHVIALFIFLSANIALASTLETTQVARSVPFDNSGTGFVSTNVQAAIQEVVAGGVTDWPNPGTIGSTTPNTGAFTTLNANKLTLSQGAIGATGIVFDSDTGMSSSGDGDLSFYTNNIKYMGLSNGNTLQIRGVDYSWPGAQAAAGNYVLINNGSGGLTWGGVPLASPPVIGNTTPNSATFTTVSANKYIAGAGDPSTTCYIFDSDTGLCSSGDGALELWANNVIGVRLDSNGIREIRGVPYLWPNAQGAPSSVLSNDGSGNLSWATAATTGSANAFAGFDNAGALVTSNFGWYYNDTYHGAQANFTVVPVDNASQNFHSFSNQLNPAANVTGTSFVHTTRGFSLGADDSGFSLDSDFSGGLTIDDIYFDSNHKSSFPDTTMRNSVVDLGNGVDAISGRNIGMDQSNIFLHGPVSLAGGNQWLKTSSINTDPTSVLGDLRVDDVGGNIQGTVNSFNMPNYNPVFSQAVPQVAGILVGGVYTDVGNFAYGVMVGPQISGTQSNNFTILQANASIGTSAGVNALSDSTRVTHHTSNGYTSANLSPTIGDTVSYTGVFNGPQITTANAGGNLQGFSWNPNVTATTGSSQVIGLNLGGGFTDLGLWSYEGAHISPNITTGTGSATGLIINMGGANVSGTKRAIDVQGGDVNLGGHVSAFASNTVVSGGGNPVAIHASIGQLIVPNAGVITNDDTFANEHIALMGLDVNSTSTAGAFGIGYADAVNASVIVARSGSSTDLVGATASALVFDASSDGGVIDTAYLYKATALPTGGTQTINRLYGLWVKHPFGDPSTASWGVYDASSKYNWLNASLKIGGSAGSTDIVQNASVGLEVEGRAVLPTPMDTTARDALTPLSGMLINNSTTGQLERYNGSSWAGIAGTSARPSSTTPTSATCSVTCGAGQRITGGGCANTAAEGLKNSYPSADDTWSCEYLGASGDCTAWGLCLLP